MENQEGGIRNPFPRLTAEARRHPDNKRLLDELGAFFISMAQSKPKSKNYDFYEYIGEKGETDEGSHLEGQAR